MLAPRGMCSHTIFNLSTFCAPFVDLDTFRAKSRFGLGLRIAVLTPVFPYISKSMFNIPYNENLECLYGPLCL